MPSSKSGKEMNWNEKIVAILIVYFYSICTNHGHADEREMCFNLDNKLYNSAAIHWKRYRAHERKSKFNHFLFWKMKRRKKNSTTRKKYHKWMSRTSAIVQMVKVYFNSFSVVWLVFLLLTAAAFFRFD